MMKDNFDKLKQASKEYVLNNKYELTEDLLEYIKERVRENEKEIKEVIDIQKENITYEDIVNVIDNEINEDNDYKKYAKLKINNEKFLSTFIAMPIGVIAVEAYETKEVIKYYIKAIKSRNAIAISDVEYGENNVKTLILIIIKEALKKFNIKEDLIMLLPYEECFYEYFDKVIYTYDKEGKNLETPKVEEKERTNELYVYIEDSSLEEEARKNQNAIILKGNVDEVIEKINEKKTKGAVIYTKNANMAYKFINLVKSQNVFVNTNLENIEKPTRKDGLLYEYENIIIPIPQEVKKEIINEIKNKETSLIVKEKKGILEKIKHFLEKIFN